MRGNFVPFQGNRIVIGLGYGVIGLGYGVICLFRQRIRHLR